MPSVSTQRRHDMEADIAVAAAGGEIELLVVHEAAVAGARGGIRRSAGSALELVDSGTGSLRGALGDALGDQSRLPVQALHLPDAEARA